MTKTRDLANLADLNFDSGTMVVDKVNDRVGVGTASPSANLDVASSNATIHLTDTDDTTYAEIRNNGGTFTIASDEGAAASNSSINFRVDGTERMRIDSSGNLLVGKTSASSSTVGFETKPTGFTAATRDGNTVLVLNRKTSDGTITDFRKDDSTVGSIGSTSGSLSITATGSPFIAGTSSQSVGLRMNSSSSVPAIIPVNNANTIQNGAIDLGFGSGRFKDLYLSGGVYLGGTGSANYLDDYEEGTWTPYYEPENNSFSSITYDTGVTNGYYTKIGNRVFVQGRIRTDALTVGTASGTVFLAGLPFNSSASAGAMAVGYSVTWAGNSARMGFFTSGTSRITLVDTPTSTGNTGTINTTDLSTNTNANYMYFSANYYTTA